MMEFGASIVLTVLLFGVSSFPYDDVMIIYLRDDDYVTVLADKMLSFQVFWRSCYFLGGQVWSFSSFFVSLRREHVPDFN